MTGVVRIPKRLVPGILIPWFLVSVLGVTAQPVTPSPGGPPPERLLTVVASPDRVAPGEVLRLLVESGEVSTVRGTVRWPDGGESSAVGVRPAGRGSVRQLLFGVDSFRAAGEGRWTVSVTLPGGTVRERTGTFELVAREFGRQEIPLDARLTQLRTTEVEARAAESRLLWRLLTTPNPRARYHPGPLRLPISAERRTSAFGLRRVYFYSDGETATTIHNGVDIAAPTGTPIVAPGAGRVVMATDRIITGLTVVIEHVAGVFSLFYHLDEMAVEAGVVVAAGDVIGTVGNTGLSTGPHLHWEVRVAGAAVDPDLLTRVPLVDTSGWDGDTRGNSESETEGG